MSSQDNKNINFQYASTNPSVASILNLATVQDKKKPIGKVAGLSMGLAVNKSQTTGIIKLKPQIKNSPNSGNKNNGDNKYILKSKATSVDSDSSSSVLIESSKKQEPLANLDLKSSELQTPKSEKSNFKTKNKDKVIKATNSSKIQNTKTKTRTRTSDYENKNNNKIENNNNHFDPSHWRLFVGNLGPEVTESLLLTTFQNIYPSTSRVLIVNDWKTQKSKGYGFVAFAEGKEFLRALKEMQGKWIGNRQCIIKKSEHQPTLTIPSTSSIMKK